MEVEIPLFLQGGYILVTINYVQHTHIKKDIRQIMNPFLRKVV